MPFIDNNKFKEILQAYRDGNEKASIIMQAMRKNGTQEGLDRLVDDYYGVGDVVEEAPIEDVEIVSMSQSEPQDVIPEELQPETIDMPTSNDVKTVDISDLLGGETEGLFDEEDFVDLSFADFLKNKKRDANRALKNADYFKAFDMEGRHAFGNKKVDEYRKKFDESLKDIERKFGDMDNSIALYIQSSNDSLDDDVEFDKDKTANAYNNLTGSDVVMRSMGRHWDNNDTTFVFDALKNLMSQYGKKNVIAALNILKDDNNNYRDFLNNSIDQNISKFSKSVEKLLK